MGRVRGLRTSIIRFESGAASLFRSFKRSHRMSIIPKTAMTTPHLYVPRSACIPLIVFSLFTPQPITIGLFVLAACILFQEVIGMFALLVIFVFATFMDYWRELKNLPK